MVKLTVEDLRQTMKLLTLTVSEQRLPLVVDFLNQVLESLKPLTQKHLPKELEPTSYLKLLSKAGEE